ncbi:hypothetical protein [Echinicola rosea]|uniref:Uncharacterized protein n=1 Tax=Echinicola rosea TaxID=1807691 RepID=A0ABQ1UY13_9BACT|nr:hypothetical protein [Echinicola rosea]GGF29796.1 hypothetical protein GCM10011339_17520 [Echinicola rosea]
MKHRFYNKSEKSQKRFIILISIAVFMVFAFTLAVAFLTKQYWISILVAPLIMIVAPFIDTPMGKRSGKLVYYSPMFITERLDNDKTVFHGGTLFDYFYVLDFNLPGYARTQWILLGYLKGLLNFIEKHQDAVHDQMVLEGTSYILQDNAAKKLGFHPISTEGIQQLILLANFPTLTIAYSLSKNKLSFPDLRKIKTYRTSLKQLREKQPFIKSLHNSLEKKIKAPLARGSYNPTN